MASSESFSNPRMNGLLAGQKRLLLLHQLHPESLTENVPFLVRFNDGVNSSKLTSIFQQLLLLHPILSSVFSISEDGDPSFKHREDFHIPVEWNTACECPDWRVAAKKSLDRPFDLFVSPPVRASIIEEIDGSSVLCMVFHHIVVDGASLQIILRDLNDLYVSLTSLDDNGRYRMELESPAERRVSDQNYRTTSDDIEYWIRELEGFEALNFPVDRQRSLNPNFAGENVHFQLSLNDTANLERFAMRQRSALSSVICATFQILLSIHSRQSDITIGTVLSGRDEIDSQDVVGFFVRTVVLRATVSPDITFRQLLKTVNSKMLLARDHQGAQFDQVVSAVQSDRKPGRNPIFDVMFVHHGNSVEAKRTQSRTQSIYRLDWPRTRTRYDLELNTSVESGRLQVSLTYRPELLRHSSAISLSGRLESIIRQILTNPDIAIGEIEVLSTEEQQQLSLWNAT
ncbi:condensation domain-containing protein, partial [Rhodococcus erythropolis]|nr:condensation domain-containing protein [Rhodococcus erythropolis]